MKYALFVFLLGYGPLLANPTLPDQLMDVENAYKIIHVTDDNNELINIYFADNDEKALHSLLDNSIQDCEKLRALKFNSETLKTYAGIYLTQSIQGYELLKKYRLSAKECKTYAARHRAQKKVYMDYIVNTYPLSRFVHLTEKKYWSIMDKKNYIHSEKYAAYEQLKKTDLKHALILLDSLAGSTADYPEKVIYELELADQYVLHDTLPQYPADSAIDRYKAILDENRYCLYVYETWLKWRDVSQENGGLSKTSDIPNYKYDEVREKLAAVILGHIRKNPTDEMAINQFLVLTTHDIIFRFGDYPYGNQNTVEFHEIFDN